MRRGIGSDNEKTTSSSMGVYGLTTVVANCGKHGASLRTAIQASGRSALLFDGASFLYHVCTCNAFLEAAELKEQCRRWVEGLRACGAEPIFFFDGVHSANKMRTLRQRREEDAKLVAHLYATAVSQHVNKKAKEPTGRVLPLLAKEVVLACLRELNVEVHQSVGEADGLIAAHFRRNREHVFGVVSGDSDFLIFDVRLLPLNKLIWTGEDWRFDAFGNVETARSIGLKSTDLLGIFSCLVGNDYTREELERFPNFRDLLTLKTGASGQKSSFIRNVAVFCNQFLEGKSEDEQVQLVEQHLLIHCRNKDAIVTAIHASLRIIHGNTSEDEALEESMWSGLPRGFRDAFERGQVDNSLLAVLWKRDFWARLSFCSAELEINPVVRPLRLRLFGFLLGRSNVAVTEYFQQGVNFVFEKVMSEYRDGKTNYFERIWSGEKPELTRDQSLKVVLRKIVLPSDAEAVSAIVALPDELRLAVATLRYLMQRSHESEEEPFLFVWEPMVVLLHLLCRHFGVADIFANQPSAAQSFSSKKVRALLLKVPVSRTITVASAFQVFSFFFFFFHYACL